MSDMLEVFPIGAKVTIDGDIPATIVAFEVRGDTDGRVVTYQCVWWDERTRKSEWITEGEIVPVSASPARIAFK
jgi:uncharacterized protein YodC (DUF2158 family)